MNTTAPKLQICWNSHTQFYKTLY